MNGREVFRFAVKIIPEYAERVLQEAGLNINDVDWIIFHQANLRIRFLGKEKVL